MHEGVNNNAFPFSVIKLCLLWISTVNIHENIKSKLNASFTESRRASVNFATPVFVSANITSAPTKGINVKFDI